MSDERLRIKLIGAGYEEEHILSLEREALLATYAEYLASGKPRAEPVGYDPTVERERLTFEREKWEVGRQETLSIAEFEKEKWEAEQEERRRREEAEQEDKKRREFLEQEQLNLKKQELQ